jgi:hypothetical protein
MGPESHHHATATGGVLTTREGKFSHALCSISRYPDRVRVILDTTLPQSPLQHLM